MRLIPYTAAVVPVLLAAMVAPASATVTRGDTHRQQTVSFGSVEGTPAPRASRASTTNARPVAARADVGPLPGLVPTRIHWTRWSTRVVHGAKSTLEGQVVTEAGAVPEATVEVYARPAGSSWKLLGTAVSDRRKGIFRYGTHEPPWTTDYRVVYEGDLFHGRSQGNRRVGVARRVPSDITPSGAALRFVGKVVPSYANRTVRLERKTSSSGRWSTVASRSTSSTSAWSFTVRGPATGTWYYRTAVPSDSRYVTSYSASWGIGSG